jgi:hypothetical protein
VGDALHAVLCGAGHNLRMILAHLRVLFVALVAWLFAAKSVDFRGHRSLALFPN